MENPFTLTKAYSIKKPVRVIQSLTSQLTVVVISVLTFFFFAFDMFKFEYLTKTGTEVIFVQGYQAFNYPNFGAYVKIFIVLTLMVSFIILAAYCMQILSAFSVHGLNMVLLGFQIVCFEFLISIYSIGGWILLSLYAFNYLQYFIFLDKHQKLDYWVFGLVLLLILAMLPSALTSSSLFQQ